MNTETVHLSQIEVNEANPRKIMNDKFEKLVRSILILPKMLELRPIVVDNTMTVLGGNMRLRALTHISEMTPAEINTELGKCSGYEKKTEAERDILRRYWERWLDCPTAHIIKASELTDAEQREFIIKDNVGYGEWDMDALANEWDTSELVDWGLDLWEDNPESNGSGSSLPNSAPESSLFDRFIIPPFSILDTRKGYWQDRKKKWYDLIGDMGESRNDTLVTSLGIKYKDLYQRTREHRKELGLSFREYIEKYVPKEDLEREQAKIVAQGVSILDPVMAEIVCRWFSFKGCKSFDCFAGDSVFGFVSAYLGNEFTGIELRSEQAKLNNERVADMTARYICDDGQNVAKHIEPESQDLLFSCPPYFDLEVYSDLPNDASNQDSYEDFIQILKNAFTAAISCLKQDRFAVICVGDVRDKKTGFYYDFCGDIKRIFKEAGVLLYNEIILVEQTASTALIAARYMEIRKVAKTHQHILVFFKGNPKNIKNEFPRIEYTEEDMKLFDTAETDTPDNEPTSNE
jgi:DNA modification methylase